jgi:ribonucleoside-diphosphate reductase alpha chain
LIYKNLTRWAYGTSTVLAKERGAFPVYDYEKEKNNEFIQQVMAEVPSDSFYKEYGRRNIACTTTAPAGSVSVLTQTTSGIEPAFMTSYTRRKKINPGDKEARVDFVDDLGDKWQEFTVYHHPFEQWMKTTGETDVKKSPYYKATANDIDWVAKVKAQAAAQRWIDHAISNTTNIPEDTDVETVKQIYMTGWESGCKGVTVYREGSRSGVLINPDPPVTSNEIQTNNAPKRPVELECYVHHMTVLGEKWLMFVGLLHGKPYELMGGLSKYVSVPKRVTRGKIVKHNGIVNPARYDFYYDYEQDEDDATIIRDINNAFENATYAAFTRTISLALRHGAPVRYVVEQIQKGAEKEDDLFSFSKAASRVLKQYIENGIEIKGKRCLECSSESLIYEEGCAKCTACGSSKCG